MAALLPMAVYGLEVPCGDIPISGRDQIQSAFRITMAAIDPSAEPEGEDGALPRATLKIIRQALDMDDDDDEYDSDEFDADAFERALAQADMDDDEDVDDDEDEYDDSEVNGGPSDPAKSKKARKAAAQQAVAKLLAGKDDMDLDEDEEEMPNGINGTKKSAKALGKLPADEDDEDSDDGEDLEFEEFVLCTLDPTKTYQQPLDITVGDGERVLFKVTGTHSVYLTGNYVVPAGDDDHYHGHGHDHDHDHSDEDDDEEYDLEPDSDELDEDEEDEMDDLDTPRVMDVTEEEDEKEAPALVKVAEKKKAEKKGKNKRPIDDSDLDASTAATLDDLISKTKADITNGEQEPKLSKKQLKKLKKNDGTAAAPEATKPKDEPSSETKKVQFAKNLEQGPTPTKDAKAGDKDAKTAALGVKTVQGVKIDDKKAGTGPAAKSGDRVGMRYIGKLEKNGKVFDSNKKGKPFSFKLGAGEVIKGWDIGIAGMAVGGERRLTIPAHHAYGAKGAGGDIPPNSTLVFDVKLLEISGKGK